MSRTTVIILAAFFGFVSIVCDQLTYQIEKRITVHSDELNKGTGSFGKHSRVEFNSTAKDMY